MTGMVHLFALFSLFWQIGLFPASRTSVPQSTNNSPALQGIGGHYIVAENATGGTVIGDIIALDRDGDTLTYTLVDGTGFAINSSSGELTVTTPPSRSSGNTRTITVRVSDGTTTDTAQYSVLIIPNSEYTTTGVTREFYSGISGGGVDSLTSASKYINNTPDAVTTVSRIDQNTSVAENFGYRYLGYLIPPTSGSYRFWIASDDSSEFRIGTNATRLSLNSSPDAYLSGWTTYRKWDGTTSQVTSPITLIRGQAYALEVLFKESGGAEHIALAWQGPGMAAPVNANDSAVVPSSSLRPYSTITNTIPPAAPEYLTVETVDTTGVTLVWTSSDSNITQYTVYRNGSLLTTIPATLDEYYRYVDNSTTGTHTYTVIAADANNNQSIPSTLTNIDASRTYNAYTAAVTSGNPQLVTDATQVITQLRTAVTDTLTTRRGYYEAVYDGVTSISYTPSSSGQLFAPLASAAARVFPLLKATTCGSSACTTTIASFGFSTTGSRFAAMPWNPFGVSSYQPAFQSLLAWLITGDNSTAPSSDGNIAILNNQSSTIKSTLISWGYGTTDSISVCSVSTMSSCFVDTKLIIVGSNLGGDANATAVRSAIESAIAANIPILYAEDYSFYTNGTQSAIGSLLGFEAIAMQFFSTATASYSDVPVMIDTLVGNEFTDLLTVVGHLEASDWSVDLSSCAIRSCSGTAAIYLNDEFYAGARTFMQTRLKAFDRDGTPLFSTPVDQNTPLKYAVLLGDIYRRHIVYNLNANSAPLKQFFRAYFADHAVLNLRPYNPAQPDLGSFSKPIPGDAPLGTKSVSFETRLGDYFTAATVYAHPGVPFTVTRTDSGSATVRVFVNSVREGSTHEMDNYSRPKYLQSAHMTLTSGETQTITSPYGGPVQLWIAGTSTAETISVDFANVGQHAVWDGPDSTADFTQRLELADYDWAEFLTPGFQIHSRRALMLETLQTPDWNTPEKLATVTMDSFYIANYNLAGFTGPSLSLSPTLETICDDMGWTCTGRSLHGITSMNHFNADQATCGYGCSGNPYDAWWAFSPLGWGDSHEMGHNIQRLHVNKRNGSVATGEVSNNIYPSFVVYLWNQDFPSRYRMSKEWQQDIFFKGLNNAQKTTNPYDAMSKMIWDGEEPSTSIISETDVNWGLYRLDFYMQLVQQSRLNPTVKFGNGGWDLITMLYMADRLRENYDNDNTTWAANRDRLGMSTYSADESRSIDNNSKLLLQVSWITKRDQRNFFTMWGIKFDSKSSAQVAAYGFPAAAKLYYYFPYDSTGKAFWTTNAIGSLPVDSTTRTIPRVPLNFTTTPNDTREVSYGTPITLTAYVGASGTVNFKANGVTIPGCGAVATAVRTADQPIDSSINDVVATCVWTPRTTGEVILTNTLDNAAVGSLDATSPAVTMTVLTADVPNVPSAPTGVTATAGNAQATISWNAPIDDGGSPITGYAVTSAPDALTCSTNATSCIITGLRNNTAYTFTVVATNSAGDSESSAPSLSVTPKGVPDAPRSVMGTVGNGFVNLRWNSPTSDGGSRITDYVIQFSSNNGSTWTTFNDAVSATTSTRVTGLTNGTNYVFRVSAKNANGTGEASANSPTLTPITVATAPRITSILAGPRQLTIRFSAPTNNGGSPITKYQYSLNNGTWKDIKPTNPTTMVITGLPAGKVVSITIRAVNAAGNSPSSNKMNGTPRR